MKVIVPLGRLVRRILTFNQLRAHYCMSLTQVLADASKVSIQNPRFNSAVYNLINHCVLQLGVNCDDVTVTPELYKLLIYQPGDHFVRGSFLTALALPLRSLLRPGHS